MGPGTPEFDAKFKQRWRAGFRALLLTKGVPEDKVDGFVAEFEKQAQDVGEKLRKATSKNV